MLHPRNPQEEFMQPFIIDHTHNTLTCMAWPLSFQADTAMSVSSESSSGAIAEKYSKKSGAGQARRSGRGKRSA